MANVNAPGPRRRKSLGQHFLADPAILRRIVAAAALGPDDLVVEVGPGLGTLTRPLLELAGRVVAVEIDPHLAEALPRRLGDPPNLTVITGDARTVDPGSLSEAGKPFKMVSNLPFYAANPIIRHFLEAARVPSLMVVMVQKEVAGNMVAKPGNMGLLSVAVQLYARARMVCSVPPRAFRPPPKVASAVVRLDLFGGPAVPINDVQGFFNVVRAGFSAPRKQLRNSLSHGLSISGGAADDLLETVGVSGKRRAETLTLEEWAGVYGAWELVKTVAD